jgi:CheY-like chemotaxis protein
MGHDVRTASSAAEGLGIAKEHKPQIVVSDIGMPDVDGYEFARQLRLLPEMQGAALVALTGFGQENDRQRTMEAGFDYHLVKPASLEALQRLLESISARQTGVMTEAGR